MVRLELDSLEVVAERRMTDKMNTILDNPSHPLTDELWQMGRTFSHQLIPLKSGTECFRRLLARARCHYDSTTVTVTKA